MSAMPHDRGASLLFLPLHRAAAPLDGFLLRLANLRGKLYNSEVFSSALNGDFRAKAIDIFFFLSLFLIPPFHKSLLAAADVITHQLLNLVLL